MNDTYHKIKAIRAEIREEYTQPGYAPWVIGYSGGKDSTLVTQLVVETLLSIPPADRTRPVHVVYNDTQVESPVFQKYVVAALHKIGNGVRALKLPMELTITTPDHMETFWINLLGKGYPAPNRNFRWCMDRLKIRPSSEFIINMVNEFGKVILLLGVRRAESAARQQRIDGYSAANNHERIIPNTDIPGCFIFRPIKDLATEEVWDYLRDTPPPWGSNATLSMLEIYQDAGMCNATQSCALMDEVATTDSKSILARFGCWTCTVIKRDKSLEALVATGYPELKPLIDFRERMREVSDTPDFRSKTRRNGQPGLGPLTFEARELLLNELLKTQESVGLELISPQEILLVKEQWEKDKNTLLMRELGINT